MGFVLSPTNACFVFISLIPHSWLLIFTELTSKALVPSPGWTLAVCMLAETPSPSEYGPPNFQSLRVWFLIIVPIEPSSKLGFTTKPLIFCS